MTDIAEIVQDMQSFDWGEFDLVKDTKIDRYDLDTLCVIQPSLIAKWNGALAQASTERDKAKEQLKVKEAELILRGQTECTSKKTDAGIKAWMMTHDERKELADAYHQSESYVNHLFAAKSSIEAKKEAIELVGKLYLSGYYSNVNVPKEASQAAETSMRKEYSDKITTRLDQIKAEKD